MNILDAVTCLPDAHLQLTVPDFEYPRPDMPTSVHFVGALPITPNQAPLPPWFDDLDGARKVVLVTQGTLSNHDFSQLVEPTLAALAAPAADHSLSWDLTSWLRRAYRVGSAK